MYSHDGLRRVSMCVPSSLRVYLSFVSLRLHDSLHGTSGLGGIKNMPPAKGMNMRPQLLSYQYYYTYLTYPSVATNYYIRLI